MLELCGAESWDGKAGTGELGWESWERQIYVVADPVFRVVLGADRSFRALVGRVVTDSIFSADFMEFVTR
ncbi:hypothetical protein CFREI_04170 [Corynebacterium freiburgense]|nr:hypothetical protein CFREI_04170 [Corynebacterium freiburgense]